MKSFSVVFASIFCLLLAVGVAAEEDNKDAKTLETESIPKITTKNYALEDFDRNFIRKIIKTNNKGLPIKEVMIVTESFRSDGKIYKMVTVMVFGYGKEDFFERKGIFNEDGSFSSIKRDLKLIIRDRNKAQATAGERINYLKKNIRLEPEENENSGEESKEEPKKPKKPRPKFKVIKLKKK